MLELITTFATLIKTTIETTRMMQYYSHTVTSMFTTTMTLRG